MNHGSLIPRSRNPWPPQWTPRQPRTPGGPQRGDPWPKIGIAFLVFVAAMIFLANLKSILTFFGSVSHVRSAASFPDALQGLVHLVIIVTCIAGTIVLCKR